MMFLELRKFSAWACRAVPGAVFCAVVVGLPAVRSALAQTPAIPNGLVTAQAASVVVGQKNFSDITSGSDNQRWGSISGIAIAGNRLIVADSSYLAPPNNNRVLIYNDLNALRQRKPQDEIPNADVIVGQDGPGLTNGGTSATQMFQPSGVATDGTRLFVSDWGNNRVLVYNQIPTSDGAAANLVIGQPDFTSQAIGTTAKNFRRPNSVSTDGTRLFVSDTLNNRVVIFNSVPTANGASADIEIGQPNFTSFPHLPTASNTLFDPMSATTDGQRLIVTDFGNNRVLIYNRIPTQNGASADVVVGQPDFIGNSAGNTESTLNFPRYAYSDGTRLVIVDSGNNRILIYNQIPTANGAAADIVLGQEDFLGLLESCASSNFAVPVSATSSNGMLFVSDAFNRRILGFQPGANLVTSVLNGASFSSQPQTAACDVILVQPPIAPGGIASIFGNNLADTTKQADSLPLPTEMGGVRVKFNGIPAPLFYVSSKQLNVQVPFELAGYSASMVIERQTSSGAMVSAAFPIGVANGAPGIFTWDGTGTGPGVIVHADFTPVNDGYPAAPGETLVAFVTGLGTVDQPMTNGAAAQFGASGNVTVGGVVGEGQVVTITVNGTDYSYTAVTGDIIATILQGLADAINNDPNAIVTATAFSDTLAVRLTAKARGDDGVNISYSGSVSDGSTLSATADNSAVLPGAVTLGGTVGAGQDVTITLAGTDWTYTTIAGDTLNSVLTNLAAVVENGDPNVTASADLARAAIFLRLRDGVAGSFFSYAVSVSDGATITATTARQFFVAGIGSATNTVSATIGENLPVVPGDLLLFGTADPGQTITVSLADVTYSYTTVDGDTLQTVVTNLANVINGDPNVSATPDTTALKISLALKDATSTVQIGFSVSLSKNATIVVGLTSTKSIDAVPASLSFAGPVKGSVGLYQVNFTVPPDAVTNPVTKLTFKQNLIVFGSVTSFDIFSNQVTFPVVKP